MKISVFCSAASDGRRRWVLASAAGGGLAVLGVAAFFAWPYAAELISGKDMEVAADDGAETGEMDPAQAAEDAAGTADDVVEASSGLDAFRVLSKEHFSLVILDINMPDVNGLEVIRFIRTKSELNKETPLLIISTESSARDRERGLALGDIECASARGLSDHSRQGGDRGFVRWRSGHHLLERSGHRTQE